MAASVLAIYVGGIAGIIFALGWFFGPLVVDQMTNLWTQRQELVNNVVQSASTSFGWQFPPGTPEQMVHNLEETFGRPEELREGHWACFKSMLGILVMRSLVDLFHHRQPPRRTISFCALYLKISGNSSPTSHSRQT